MCFHSALPSHQSRTGPSVGYRTIRPTARSHLFTHSTVLQAVATERIIEDTDVVQAPVFPASQAARQIVSSCDISLRTLYARYTTSTSASVYSIDIMMSILHHECIHAHAAGTLQGCDSPRELDEAARRHVILCPLALLIPNDSLKRPPVGIAFWIARAPLAGLGRPGLTLSAVEPCAQTAAAHEVSTSRQQQGPQHCQWALAGRPRALLRISPSFER
jgi:hypothetical protein